MRRGVICERKLLNNVVGVKRESLEKSDYLDAARAARDIMERAIGKRRRLHAPRIIYARRRRHNKQNKTKVGRLATLFIYMQLHRGDYANNNLACNTNPVTKGVKNDTKKRHNIYYSFLNNNYCLFLDVFEPKNLYKSSLVNKFH